MNQPGGLGQNQAQNNQINNGYMGNNNRKHISQLNQSNQSNQLNQQSNLPNQPSQSMIQIQSSKGVNPDSKPYVYEPRGGGR